MARTVIVREFGGFEYLEVVTTPEPHAGPGQVRVRVSAAGLNPIDLRIAEGGQSAARFGVEPPFVNGNDFAGVIDEVGQGVGGWTVGQRVYGGARCAAQTDFLIVDDLTTLNPTRPEVDDETSSVLDIAGRTALAGIRALHLGATDTVLISAAAGGVGLLACQLARNSGATVIGTASAHNADFLRTFGVIPIAHGIGLADRIAAAAPNGITAVFDAHGEETIDLGLGAGVAANRINSVADRAAAERLGVLSVGRGTTPTSAVTEIADQIATGSVIVHIDAAFPVERVREAYERLATGHVRGKLTLTFDRKSRAA